MIQDNAHRHNSHWRLSRLLLVLAATTVAAAVDGRVLTATAMDAHNSFDQPEVVKPAQFTGAKLERGELRLTLPAQSVLVLELR
jgi:alpha-L-arabinofuranosidase